MLIGIMTDSHDNLSAIDRAMEFFKQKNIDFLIHLGDFVAPFAVKRILDYKIPVKAVFGNNDGEKRVIRQLFSDNLYCDYCSIAEDVGVIELTGKIIAYTHGHEEYVVSALIDSGKYDVVLSGHTHNIMETKSKNTLYLNPGEACGWLTGKGSVATMNLDNLEIKYFTYPAIP